MTSFRHFRQLLIILLLVFFLAETKYLHSQSEITVVKIRQTYAIINTGTLDGIKVGDHFTVQTPNRPSQYGEVEVIKASKTISAVKIILGIAGYSLKVGDIVAVSTNLSPEQLLNEAVNLDRHDTKPKVKDRQTAPYYDEPYAPTQRTNYGRSSDSYQASRRGSVLIGGSVSFLSQGGDFYEIFDNDRLNTILVQPTILYFIIPNLSLGASIGYRLQAQGDFDLETFSLGPRIGYFIGTNSGLLPFFIGGVNYNSYSYDVGFTASEDGFGFILGTGFLFCKGHLGIGIEFAFVHERYSTDQLGTFTGNSILISLGLAGFLY